MRTVWAWSVFIRLLARYLCSRVGWMRRVDFRDRLEGMTVVASQLLGWRKMRVLDPEHCPKEPPAVFVSNHIWLSDPMLAWPAIYYSSGERIATHFMMRDDFFRGGLWRWLPFNVDDIAEMCGAIRISRGNVQWSQMKPFLKVLEAPGAFLMYPGGTRSRSGLVFEYRESAEEIGGASFFVSHVQRRLGKPVPAVPMARTCHPVSGQSVLAFGAPLYVAAGADRAALRAFDAELAVRVAGLIEINVPHIMSGLLYLRCLHGGAPHLGVEELAQMVRDVVSRIRGRHVDPAALMDVKDEVEAMLGYFARYAMLTVEEGVVALNPDRILSCPPLDTQYYRNNPVKFQINQILHFSEVIDLIEDAALR